VVENLEVALKLAFNAFWILCAMTLGSLLAQYLTKIDTDTLTGPVVESLILLVAMMGAAWQCQCTLGSSD
jgi:hypothetical protein